MKAPHELKVMIIDDSRTIRKTAESLVASIGATAILAENGFEALSSIVAERPDIIFVDIMMPRLDGYQTCALIKQNHELCATPVVMLSSKDGLFDKARGRIVGADDYITKPFSRADIYDAITKHTGVSASSQAVA